MEAKNPRARAPAPDCWRVLGIRLPDKDYRTFRAVVLAECDGLTLAVTVRRLRKGGGTLEITMPVAADGSPGVALPPAALDVLTEAVGVAVKANAEAWEYLGPRW